MGDVEQPRPSGAVRILLLLAVGLVLVTWPALAVNSPRPAGFRVENGSVLVITWTNLNTAHPWLLSYADAPGACRWETNVLSSSDGRLTVSRPVTGPQRFFRLWPAAP